MLMRSELESVCTEVVIIELGVREREKERERVRGREGGRGGGGSEGERECNILRGSGAL